MFKFNTYMKSIAFLR